MSTLHIISKFLPFYQLPAPWELPIELPSINPSYI